MIRHCCIVMALHVIAIASYCQDIDSINNSIEGISTKWVSKVGSESKFYSEKIDKHSKKYLSAFLRQQQKVLALLSKVNPNGAKALTEEGKRKFEQLNEKLAHPDKFSQYIPGWDSLSTSLKFLDKNLVLFKNSGKLGKNITESLEKVNDLESELQKAESIRQFMKDQEQLLKSTLDKFGLGDQIKSINKQVYYYSQQIKEYKEILNRPEKAERKALELLSKTKVYSDFMKKNSLLASLFKLPTDDPNSPMLQQALAGLQTSTQVSQLIQQRTGSRGSVTMQQAQSNIQQAQSMLQELKAKASSLGNTGDPTNMPDFKPNSQHTKNFFQRLEWGMDIQTTRSNGFLPQTTDFGASIGYKLSDKNIFGIGASYKMGWGSDIRNIHITHEGVGLRSFVDIRVKNLLWLTGGYEMNYRNIITNFSYIKNVEVWQRSGLIGLKPKFPIGSKFVRSTSVQILWDFLSYSQVPRTQPFLFRFGYSIK